MLGDAAAIPAFRLLAGGLVATVIGHFVEPLIPRHMQLALEFVHLARFDTLVSPEPLAGLNEFAQGFVLANAAGFGATLPKPDALLVRHNNGPNLDAVPRAQLELGMRQYRLVLLQEKLVVKRLWFVHFAPFEPPLAKPAGLGHTLYWLVPILPPKPPAQLHLGAFLVPNWLVKHRTEHEQF